MFYITLVCQTITGEHWVREGAASKYCCSAKILRKQHTITEVYYGLLRCSMVFSPEQTQYILLFVTLLLLLLLQDFCVPLAVEKIKHQMALGGDFEKANHTVHSARNILEYSRRSCWYSTYCTSILKACPRRFWKWNWRWHSVSTVRLQQSTLPLSVYRLHKI